MPLKLDRENLDREFHREYALGAFRMAAEFATADEVTRLYPRTVVGRARRRLGQLLPLRVRRGDYVSVARSAAAHGTCTPAYHRAALAAIEARVSRARVFAFSDDPGWVRAQLGLDAGPDAVVVAPHRWSAGQPDGLLPPRWLTR